MQACLWDSSGNEPGLMHQPSEGPKVPNQMVWSKKYTFWQYCLENLGVSAPISDCPL